MDAESFDRVYDSLQEFHAFFAASFGPAVREHRGFGPSGVAGEDRSGATLGTAESVGLARASAALVYRGPMADEKS